MADEQEQNPLDQLIDLFVYAPVGLLYEYQEVIPKLVKRGKSQVQIARVIGQIAVKGSSPDAFTLAANGVANLLARQVTEIGTALGLAPPAEDSTARSGGPPPPRAADQPPPPLPALEPDSGPPVEVSESERVDEDEEPEDRPLPIAGYEGLKAKEIIVLLDDLEPGERERIREYEEANRARKTVLGKLDRLAS